jgi:hypothetical protein
MTTATRHAMKIKMLAASVWLRRSDIDPLSSQR